MAITNNITTENSQYGIAFNGAYYRIVTAAVSRQRGTDPKFTVMIDLSGYAATPDDDTREVDFKRYECTTRRCRSRIWCHVSSKMLCLGYGSS